MSRAEVEAALFLNRLTAPLPEGYQRLYFGAEFCPWLLPTAAAAREACRAAHGMGWHFTLATPVLAEAILPDLGRLCDALGALLEPGDEVLISDWGALAAVRERLPQVPVILGRTLSGQKRGPRILDLDLTAEQRAYFRQGRWYSREATQLLAEQGIARVELDNLLQGVAPLPEGLCGSLHFPYAMVTSSRNCPFRPAGRSPGCAAGCGEVFRLSTEQTAVPLLQGGNTQFLYHPQLPSRLTSLGIDRTVFHPALPR